MINAGKTLKEIARLDDVQMRWLIFRKRDKTGRLVRRNPDLPPGVEVDDRGMRIVSNPVSFGKMYKQVRKYQGWKEENILQDWIKFRVENPKLGRAGEN